MRKRLKPLVMPLARWLAPDVLRRLEQLNDWAQLGVYQTQNQALRAQPLETDRVVFFGDSITEFWDLVQAFPGKPYINRGISGQTTAQMLVRFRPDVINLQPKAVLILAGTNDLAGNTGPMTVDRITDNYASLAELARANAIQLIFASVLPVHDYGSIVQSNLRPPDSIRALNQWLRDYCKYHQHIFLDYYHAMVDDQEMLKAELAEDGVHPNAKGYDIMKALAESAILQVGDRPSIPSF